MSQTKGRVMNDYESKVKDFHDAFDLGVALPFSAELLRLRKTLIHEEAQELFEELDRAVAEMQEKGVVSKETQMNLMKEMADLQYVLSGTAVVFGLPVERVFDRVHDSNMSKLDAEGKPLRREDGKILKGPLYHPPQLDDLL